MTHILVSAFKSNILLIENMLIATIRRVANLTPFLAFDMHTNT